jgi:hypothetical protein
MKAKIVMCACGKTLEYEIGAKATASHLDVASSAALKHANGDCRHGHHQGTGGTGIDVEVEVEGVVYEVELVREYCISSVRVG